ncbi:MAG: nei [Frankiales bacterium]|nr:nei [Frankiales bacterium]
MPEGDTVFLTAQRLNAALSGQVLTRFELRVPTLARASAVGETVREVVPVGKHILARLSDGRTLRSHLRMDGAWRVQPASRTRPQGKDYEVRALLGTARQLAVGYRLHDLALVPSTEEASLIGHLGPDLLDPGFDLAEAVRRFEASAAREPGRAIGDALLDQRLVAGIGNVYKCELLFLHRLNPWLAVGETPDLAAVLTDASRLLRANSGRFTRSTTGWTQPGQQYYVYGRAGKGCRRCGTAVRKDEQGDPSLERVLYYCPTCQGAKPSDAGGQA